MQYAAQGVKRLVVSICQSSQSVCHANKSESILYNQASSKHISQLENSHILTYAYLAKANASAILEFSYY